MSKEFVRGVTVGEGNAVKEGAQEVEQQAVREYETGEEGTRELIRENEEDFIQGLIDAAEFVAEETQRINIIREGRLYFAFNIHPLGSEEYERCRKKHTKYVRNKQLGMKMPEHTDRVKYQSEIIYAATVDEDKKKLWDNRKIWNAINEKEDRIMNSLDVIEYSLKAGEKDRILEVIDQISGYESNNLEEVAKN